LTELNLRVGLQVLNKKFVYIRNHPTDMFVGGFIDCVITAKYATEHAAEEMQSHTLQL